MPDDVKQDSSSADVGLDRYRARLGFWQAIWGTLISGGVAVAIPAMVEAYKARLDLHKAEQEVALKNKEIEGKILDNHQTFVSSFLNTALNQDIELRLRFAEYFSFLSDKESLDQWQHYHDTIEKRRNDIRDSINSKEQELIDLRSLSKPSVSEQTRLSTLERELKWNYAEVGYVRQDTNVTGPASPGPNSTAISTRADIIARNEVLFKTAIVNQNQAEQVAAIVKRIYSNMPKYESVEKATDVPWYIVGIIHQIDANGDFGANLINGDPLTARTVHAPVGRPTGGSPPFTWEEAAMDAMTFFRLGGNSKEDFQSVGGILYAFERYNGLGYRTRGMKSPFVWSCTNVYTSGLFVADATLNTAARARFCGAAALLKALSEKGVVQLPLAPVQKP